MARHEILFETDTLTLSKHPTQGYWLYDAVVGMNLAMRSESEHEAFAEALEYYQERLTELRKDHESLKTKVKTFVKCFVDQDAEIEI